MRLHAQFLSLGREPHWPAARCKPILRRQRQASLHGDGCHAQHQQDKATKAYMEATPPLWSNLGSLTYPITTRSPRPSTISTRA